MDWKACAVDDLRRYNLMKEGIKNCRERICIARGIVTAGRNSLKKNPKRRTDTNIVDAIVEVERLKRNIKVAESLIELIDRGLSALTEKERQVLKAFYMSSEPVNMRTVKERLGYERSSIYRFRDACLLKFTLAMYGVDSL